MDDQENPGAAASDEELVLLARAGDRSAFAELWERHARSGVKVAHQFTSSIDADDLVSEAYARIYQRVLAGGGPDGAFRPYLYTTIRNLASRWGSRDRSITVDDIGQFEDVSVQDDPATIALDRTLTARAFRSLPDRWQSVLWYTEVEGMDPHEVAPILGISANSVAALSYRAREGLRKAWLQAHVTSATASGECQWTIGRIGDYTRNGLTPRDRERVDAHLAECSKCSIISEEVDEVGSRLALVMIPLLLGATAGGTLLASLSAPSDAMAQAMPDLPPAFDPTASVSVVAPTVVAGLAATTASAPLVGAVALALVLSGGLAVSAVVPAPTPPASSVAEPAPASSAEAADGDPLGGPARDFGGLLSGTSELQGTYDQMVNGLGGAVDGVVNTLTDPINAIILGATIGPGAVPEHSAPSGVVGASVALDLSGTGIPGATVSVQAAGIVYATTVVTPQGTWAIRIGALPNGVGQLDVKQTLVSLLGIDILTTPVQVLSNSLGITLNLLGI